MTFQRRTAIVTAIVLAVFVLIALIKFKKLPPLPPLPPGYVATTGVVSTATHDYTLRFIVLAPGDVQVKIEPHLFSFPKNIGLNMRYATITPTNPPHDTNVFIYPPKPDTNWITLTAITGVCAKISLTGTNNAQYRIQTTTNLASAWELLPHNIWTTPPSNALYELFDTPIRWYRAVKL